MEEEQQQLNLSAIDTLAPIWKLNSANPIVECTLSMPSGTYLALENVSPSDCIPMILDDDDSRPAATSTDLKPYDIMTQCGCVLVRSTNISEAEKDAVLGLVNLPVPQVERYNNLEGYYYAPGFATQPMISLDIEGFNVLSKANSPDSKVSIMPTFHGTIAVNESDKDEILYIPAMSAVPVGIKFFTSGTISILRAPYIHEQEDEESGSGSGEEEDDENSATKKVICVTLLDTLVMSAHESGKNKVFGACSAVGDEIKEKIESLGDEIWTTLSFQPHDVFACLRGTLFKLSPSNGNETASGKLLATIRNPIPRDIKTGEKYSRIIDAYTALSTGIIKRDRWGVPFLGDNPPRKLVVGDKDDVLKGGRELENSFPRHLYLEPPYHRFTTDRCWSNGFPGKFASRYEQILKFHCMKKDFASVMIRVEDINNNAKELKKTTIIAPHKILTLDRAYKTQEKRSVEGSTLNIASLTEKLSDMKDSIDKADQELQALNSNVKTREEEKKAFKEIQQHVEDHSICAKSVTQSIKSVMKKVDECDKLPSDSRVKALKTSIVSLRKIVAAAEKSMQKKKGKGQQQQKGGTTTTTTTPEQQQTLPNPDTYVPPLQLLGGPDLNAWCTKVHCRYAKLTAEFKTKKAARKKKMDIENAKITMQRLENDGGLVTDPFLMTLANTELSEAEKRVIQPCTDEDKFRTLLRGVRGPYEEACALINNGESFDIAPLEWILDRLESWPEHPFIAVNKDGADPEKRKKYCQMTLFGTMVQPKKELVECPNDEECENTLFISEDARKKLRLDSRCLICEMEKRLSPLQRTYGKVMSAFNSGNDLVAGLAEEDRHEKFQLMMAKVEKFADQIYRTPAISRTKLEPKAWREFLKHATILENVLNGFALDQLPKVAGIFQTNADDEDFTPPEFDQYENEACGECDGLISKGTCLDCGTKQNGLKGKKRSREEEEEKEEEEEEEELNNNNNDNSGNPRTAEDLLTCALLLIHDPVVKETVSSALKKLKTKDSELVDCVVPFVAFDQVLDNGERKFNRKTARRFGDRVFSSNEEAKHYAEVNWGYKPETHEFMFFEKIKSIKK